MCISKVKDAIDYNLSWKMYFDKVSNALVHGIKAILISLNGNFYPFLIRLNFNCANNIVDYKAYIMGLTIKMNIRTL